MNPVARTEAVPITFTLLSQPEVASSEPVRQSQPGRLFGESSQTFKRSVGIETSVLLTAPRFNGLICLAATLNSASPPCMLQHANSI